MLMLIEEFYLANIELISINTDGVVIHYTEEERNTVLEIWKKWEKLTTYTLEDTYYNQIIFSSVNDYIAEIIDVNTNKTLYIKYKGDFEIDKEWHKNNSQRIVPIALKRYFIDNIPIKDTIENHLKSTDYDSIKNYGIYDFCIGRKSRDSVYYLVGYETIELTDKVIRYYIANNNKKLFKKSLEGKSKDQLSKINKGFNIELFMNYKKEENYNLDYNYYINECNKIIKPIEKKEYIFTQLELFN